MGEGKNYSFIIPAMSVRQFPNSFCLLNLGRRFRVSMRRWGVAISLLVKATERDAGRRMKRIDPVPSVGTLHPIQGFLLALGFTCGCPSTRKALRI